MANAKEEHRRHLSLTAVLVMLMLLTATGCTGSGISEQSLSKNRAQSQTDFDAELANELGADDYGMRRYVMVLLKAGPNQNQDSEIATQLQHAHMNNIRRLAEQGKLSLAGPFLDDSQLRGIFLLNVESVAQARELTGSDPAIQAGLLEMQLHPWYGSAAIQEVNAIHRKISKRSP